MENTIENPYDRTLPGLHQLRTGDPGDERLAGGVIRPPTGKVDTTLAMALRGTMAAAADHEPRGSEQIPVRREWPRTQQTR